MATHPLVSVFSGVPSAPGLAARRFAEAGVPVFPCGAGGKRPLPGSSGFHDATTDLGQVADWWGRFPNANVAIPTGRASGVVVVDVDVHGVNGFEAFGRARAAGLLPVPLAVVRTPSGGMHLYYPAHEAMEQRSWQAGKVGIDCRGDGGYIIVPPSRVRVDGVLRAYEVFQLHPDASMPVDSGRLRDFLDPRPVIQRPEAGSSGGAGGCVPACGVAGPAEHGSEPQVVLGGVPPGGGERAYRGCPRCLRGR